MSVTRFGLTHGEGAANLAVTDEYWALLPQSVREHLGCPIVSELTPITAKHDIEALVLGEP